MKIARVSFRGNLEVLYSFLTDIEELAPGDYVVCDTQNGPTVGRIQSFTAKDPKATKKIILRIPYHEFQLKESMAELDALLE